MSTENTQVEDEVSSTNEVEIPIKRTTGDTLEERLTANAYHNILPARYLKKDENGNLFESQEDLFKRVGQNVALAEAVYELERQGEEFTVTPDQIKPSHHARGRLAGEVFGFDTGEFTEVGDLPKDLDEAREYLVNDEVALSEDNINKFAYETLIDELPEDISSHVEEMAEEYTELHSNLKFIANSPTLMNAGDDLQQLSACFVNSPEDDMDNIHETAKEAAKTFKSGGGMGYAFWRLRPTGDPVGSSGGVSSGPITFMNTYDQMCETVAQGGTRRGAQMGVMRVSHPDVLEFIHAKNKDVSLAHTLRLNDPDDYTHTSFLEALEEARELIDEEGRVPKHLRNAVEGHLSNFNISVGITDDFMEAVKNDEEFTFTNPRTGEAHIVTEQTEELYEMFGYGEYVEVGEELSVPAREIWDDIIDGAHENGEPGVIYLERANQKHSFDVEEHPDHQILATNPCLSGDMEVAVAGEESDSVKISELAGRDETTLVYSVDDEGEIVIKEATAFQTKENAETITINTDGNMTLEVTPDHKIRTNNRGWVKASNLEQGDSLQILKEWVTSAIGGKDSSYKMVKSNKTFKSEHRLVARDVLEEEVEEKQIHHTNFDSLDNSPENLEYKNNFPDADVNGGKQVKIVENHKVTSIEDSIEQAVYDLNVPETHNFFAGKNIEEDCIKVFTNVHNCGEQPLEEYEACNLGHINFSTLVADNPEYQDYRAFRDANLDEFDSEEAAVEAFLEQALDWDEFNHRIEYGTRFLEDVVTMSDFPIDKIEEKVASMRKIGLGIMGYAQMLVQLGIQYGSDPANKVARQMMTHMNHTSKQVSHRIATGDELGMNRGVFSEWGKSKYADPDEYEEWFEHHTGEDTEEWDDGFPLRNHNTTTIAPTGTTSMVGNTTGGCEPMFNVAYMKNVSDDVQGEDMLVEFDDYFLRTLEANDVDIEPVKDEAKELMQANEFDGAQDLETVPEEIAELFITTSEVSGLSHASVQCAFQDGVDSSISKTANFPNDATKDDMQEVYEYIYENGGKGVTVYRDGTRSKQVLTTRADNAEFSDSEEFTEFLTEQVEEGNVTVEDVVSTLQEEFDVRATEQDGKLGLSEYRKRPDALVGMNQRINTGYGTLYVWISEDAEGNMFEVFASIGKAGGYTQSFTEALCRMISMALRYGVPPTRIVKHLSGIQSPKVAWENQEQIASVADGIAMAMDKYIEHDGVVGLLTEMRNGDSEVAESIVGSQPPEGMNIEELRNGVDDAIENDDEEDFGAGASVELGADTPEPDATSDASVDDATAELVAQGESPECPDCGAMQLYYSEGCKTCESCGWSEC